MKTYHLRSTPPAILNRFPALCKKLDALLPMPGSDPALTPADLAAVPPLVSLGGDLEKAGVCLAAQVQGAAPLALATLTREETLVLVREILARGCRIVVVVEACGFGWEFPRGLREAGSTVFTVAPEPLTGKRKTNRRDAAALARIGTERLLHGNGACGRIVREPTRSEQERRAVGRQRQKLIALRGRLEGMGRGLMLDFGIIDYPDGWWGKKMWPRLKALLEERHEPFLLEQLSGLQALAQSLHSRIRALDAQLETLAQILITTPLPAGLGLATATFVNLEVCDWTRFKNRKQAGSYTGCCPSESSTGTGQKLGSIDRMGNRRIRSALTEAIWRMKRHEPGWQGFTKWGPILFDKNANSVRKKKAVMACVRLLFIDLWRLNTGQLTLSDLGCLGRPNGFRETAEAA